MTNAWVIRAGRVGERDTWALQHGFSGGGWYEVPDLSTCLTRDQVSAVVTQTFAGEKQMDFRLGSWSEAGALLPSTNLSAGHGRLFTLSVSYVEVVGRLRPPDR